MSSPARWEEDSRQQVRGRPRNDDFSGSCVKKSCSTGRRQCVTRVAFINQRVTQVDDGLVINWDVVQ